jgi:hypothetical protein
LPKGHGQAQPRISLGEEKEDGAEGGSVIGVEARKVEEEYDFTWRGFSIGTKLVHRALQ